MIAIFCPAEMAYSKDMEVIIVENAEKASELAAKVIAKQVREKPKSVLGLATGRTPLQTYRNLIRMHREEGLSFADVTTFNLDEYVGLSPQHPQSYRYFMDAELFSQIDIPSENTHLPKGFSDHPREECRTYERMIQEAGGIDLQVLGLGSNGHIGFNEPTGSLNSRTWVKILSENTIKDNGDLFDDPDEVPRYCLTMGIGTIMEARRILVLAFGHRKAPAVAGMIEGAITSMCPASALQFHQRVIAIIDEEAAARLDHSAHYKWIDRHKLPWQRYD